MILKNMKNKRGVSPVIATVLLIAMVVVIAIIVFLWFKGISQEAITKFDGENIELACEEVYFAAEYTGGKLYITNDGNVPIYNIKIKTEGDGSHSMIDINDEFSADDWPTNGLLQGGVSSGSISFDPGATITLIPELVGKTDEGSNKEHLCDEKRYGVEI